jgi:hypothetical protein
MLWNLKSIVYGTKYRDAHICICEFAKKDIILEFVYIFIKKHVESVVWMHNLLYFEYEGKNWNEQKIWIASSELIYSYSIVHFTDKINFNGVKIYWNWPFYSENIILKFIGNYNFFICYCNY